MTSNKLEDLRQACVDDLYTFATIVNPDRLYGDVHKDLMRWVQYEESDNQLTLLPRAHQKSHIAAVVAAWEITINPATTILYVSATSTLAEKQLYAIKNILTCKIYRKLFPEMVNRDENKRERWTNAEISVDHPTRKKEGVRDATVFAAGLTTNITGLHADIIIKDDVVVPDNAYTEEGRRKVESQCSQLVSIANPGAKEFSFGTRYHPKDHWQTLKEMEEDIFDDEGERIETRQVYKIFERVVEEDNEFLWPRECREDGKWFGFNLKVLARVKAKYTDKTQFYAQYYNNPNDPDNDRFQKNDFVYYDRKFIHNKEGKIYFKQDRLNVVAAMDFAFSTNKKADYTAIVVLGICPKGYIYVLDLTQFKTDKISDYYKALMDKYDKWGFKKMSLEVTVAQKAIVQYIKDEMRKDGVSIFIDESRPVTKKEERIATTLEPRYQSQTIKHFKGGLTNILEEQLILVNPKHDDLKDALASAVNIAKPPRGRSQQESNVVNIQYHPEFGGIL